MHVTWLITCQVLFLNSMGQHFSSLKRQQDKRKTQTEIVIPGQDAKQKCLCQHLDNLLNCKLPVPLSPITNNPLLDKIIEGASGDTDPIQHVDDHVNEEIHHNSTPSVASSQLYDNW